MQSTFQAPNITCEGCAQTIRGALIAMPGVSRVDVDIPAKTVRVEHTVDRAALANALAAAGYPEAARQPDTRHAMQATLPRIWRAAENDGAAAEPTHVDPVCGMTVDPRAAASSTAHAGVTYWFCASSCLKKFEDDPQRYLTPPSERPAEPAAPDAIHICPMHPEVRQKGPGYCPKCGMALEPEDATLATGEDPELVDMRHRLIVAAVLTVPLVALAMLPMFGVPLGLSSAAVNVVQLLLCAPVVLWAGWPFFHRAWHSLIQHSPNMFTLIALGTGAAFVYSVIATLLPDVIPHTFRHGGVVEVYFEAASVIITLVLLGQVLELKARQRASEAIRRLLELAPATARLVQGEREIETPLGQIKKGDLLRVRPGDKVPLDGVVTDGTSTVDESMISGESMPVGKAAGDAVIGGTVNQHGAFLMRVTKVGADTMLSQIIHLVGKAQRSRVPIQRLADRVAGVFVPIVILVALFTLALWMWLGPAENALSHGLVSAVAVLIIACPCALGLATPMSIMVGVGRGASEGILFKNAEALETLQKVDAVAFDKTGTLTEGNPRVTDVVPAEGVAETELIRFAAGAERSSEHPLAAAVVRLAQERGMAIPDTERFGAIPGDGVQANVAGRKVIIGNRTLLQQRGVSVGPLDARANALRGQGKTVVHVALDGQLAGLLAFADAVKPSTPKALAWLKDQGIRIVMLTGDDPRTAQGVAEQLGISEYHARVSPADKQRFVQQLRDEGRIVAMAGDGINDAPALAAAHVGIAMGAGTDVAIESAGVTLVRGDLRGLARAMRLSQRVIGNIRQNLFFAFIYNLLGVPIAAGVLYPFFGLLLNPMIAAAAMSMSSVSVIANALRLRRGDLST